MDAELGPKTLKIFDMTAANAILMKFTTIMYLHKIFNSAQVWGVTQRVQEGVNEKPLKMSEKISFFV